VGDALHEEGGQLCGIDSSLMPLPRHIGDQVINSGEKELQDRRELWPKVGDGVMR
jgi:hypothetical protein